MDTAKNKTITINFQEAPMSLFRNDFKLEKKSQDGYMKLQKGENKIRILSQFIDGWEDWEERDGKKVPVRSREKREYASKECKQFVAAIVWNYNERRIQILSLTQSSIIKSLVTLSEDQDWGPVWFYDIKITRTGDDKLTRYAVNPLPRKSLTSDIEKEFQETPINLQAMFTGGDPFKPDSNRTIGVFKEPDIRQESVKSDESKISLLQHGELVELMGEDSEFIKEFKIKLERAFGSSKINDIPASQFAKIRESLMEHQRKQAVV